MAFPKNKLVALRESKGLTRDDLAVLSGLSRRTIDSIEQGATKNPGHDKIAALCTALKVKCDYFFTPDIPDPVKPKTPGRPKKSK